MVSLKRTAACLIYGEAMVFKNWSVPMQQLPSKSTTNLIFLSFHSVATYGNKTAVEMILPHTPS